MKFSDCDGLRDIAQCWSETHTHKLTYTYTYTYTNTYTYTYTYIRYTKILSRFLASSWWSIKTKDKDKAKANRQKKKNE